MPEMLISERTTMELHDLILHIRMVHRFYISENVRFRQIGLSQLRAIMELENHFFPLFLWFGKTMWHNHLEWKNLQTKRKAESLLYGYAGSESSAFYRDNTG